MRGKECMAVILAGGRGERLGSLTYNTAKPIVFFGGNYRIIDFALSNCVHSKINTIAVLTQYKQTELQTYIKNSRLWDLLNIRENVYIRPSANRSEYIGTADAVYQNIEFIDRLGPKNVLILSGDHIYKMDYRPMLEFHKANNADVTIASTTVPFEEASRFGILNINRKGMIYDFVEKPKIPESNHASMGIYIFKWNCLKKLLMMDHCNNMSQKDFGKNIIPAMLLSKKRVFAYKFDSYWRDVGTIQSLWESNMDLLNEFPKLGLHDRAWKIFTTNQIHSSCYISSTATVKRSIFSGRCKVRGKVENSILSDSTEVGEGSEIVNSIIMPNVMIGRNVKINKSIIGADALIMDGVAIGVEDGINMFVDSNVCTKDISVVAPNTYIAENMRFKTNSHIDQTLIWSGACTHTPSNNTTA